MGGPINRNDGIDGGRWRSQSNGNDPPSPLRLPRWDKFNYPLP